MSQNEVQANSVIYSRNDYIAVLTDAKTALSKLAALREAQIAEWSEDTEAREADLNELIMNRYTRRQKYHYKTYLDSLIVPEKQSWLDKLMGRKPEPKTDEYGSLEAFIAAKTGRTFSEYKASELTRVQEYCQDGGVLEYLRWFSCNARKFLDNDWADELRVVTQHLSEVEYGNFDAQFVIPREEFSDYTKAMILAESGKIPAVSGKLYPDSDLW